MQYFYTLSNSCTNLVGGSIIFICLLLFILQIGAVFSERWPAKDTLDTQRDASRALRMKVKAI